MNQNTTRTRPETAGGTLAVGVDRATQISGVGRTTIYAAMRAGELQSVKIGSRRLIPIDDLREWLDAHRVG